MWACEVESGQCEYWGEKKNQPTSESTIITLLRGCKESALHYSPNGNQLDGPVILPRPNALHNIHFVFHIVQFNNFRFFANHSSFFGGLGLIYDTFLWSRLLEACSEIGIATNCALERRCKTDSVRRGHEGVREEEWHLTTMVWETRKIWCMRDGNALCTDLTAHSGSIASGDVNWIVSTTFTRSILWIHGKLKQVTKIMLPKKKGSQKPTIFF